MPTTISVTGELRNWSYEYVGDNFFCVGRIYDDKKERFANGHLVRTANLQAVYHFELVDIVVTQTGSTYMLYHDKEEKRNVIEGTLPGKRLETWI